MLKEQTESYKTIIREHLPRKKKFSLGLKGELRKKIKIIPMVESGSISTHSIVKPSYHSANLGRRFFL